MASVVKFQYHIFRILVNEEPQFIKHWAEVRLIYKHFPFRTQLWSQLTFPAGSKMMWNFYGYRTKDMKWSFLDMSSGSDTHDWLIIPGKKQKGTPRHGTIQFVTDPRAAALTDGNGATGVATATASASAGVSFGSASNDAQPSWGPQVASGIQHQAAYQYQLDQEEEEEEEDWGEEELSLAMAKVDH